MKLNLVKKIQGRVINKLLLINSAVIILVMMMLLCAVSIFYIDVVIKKEQTENLLMLGEIKSFFDEKNDDAEEVVRTIESDEVLLNDAIVAMNSSYSNYLSNKLDIYSENPSFIPKNIEAFLHSFYFSDGDICGVSLINMEGTSFDVIINSNLWYENLDEIESYKNNFSKTSLSNQEKQFVDDIYVINKPFSNPITSENVGNICFYFDLENLHSQIKNDFAAFNGSIYTVDNSGQLVFSSCSEVIDIEMVESTRLDSLVKYQGDRYIVSTLTDSDTEYYYISVTPLKSLSQLVYFLIIVLTIAILLTVFAVVVTSFLMRSYSKRISVINDAMLRVQSGDFDVEIPVSNEDDELTLISKTFNQMQSELKDYIDKVYIRSIKQREAELRALQTQVNPHFLYNSLEVIRMKATIEEAKVTSEMIVYLGKIFRYSLETKEDVVLQEEVVFIVQHLKMFQYRFPDKLEVELDIEDECRNIYLLRFMLQPIVENYLIHGFQKDKSDNLLRVVVKKMGTDVEICIQDNGNGIPGKRLAELVTKLEQGATDSSIGLQNVHQRLQLKYGSEYGLTLDSIEGQGTTVTFMLPYNKDF